MEAMTETERITNAIYDSYAAMPQEVENLGRLAAQCELEAWREGPGWLKKSLLDQARAYRDAKIACCSPLHICRTSGCLNVIAGDDYCARCSEETNGDPYTFANILSDTPKWAHWLYWGAVFFAASVALSILLILL